MRFIAALLLLVSSVFGATTTITSNTVITGQANYAAATSLVVAEDIYLAYDNKNGQLLNNFNGAVTVLGELYIGDTGTHTGMSVHFNGDLTNSGTIVLNAQNETSAPSFYYQGNNFINNGNIFMVGIGNTGGMTSNVWNTQSVVNNGIITYYQTLNRSGGTSYFGRSGNSVTNSGTLCLYQMNMYQYSVVSGTGCYSVGENSLLLYEYPQSYTLATTQTVFLQSSTSQIRIGNHNMINPLTVSGWGNGNIIGFQTTISSFSYSGDTLTVVAGGFIYYFIIGEGYNINLITQGSGLSSGGYYITSYLKYSGTPPNTSRPAVCQVCPEIPQFPNLITSSFSSSVSSLSSSMSDTSSTPSETSASATPSSSANESSASGSSSSTSASESASGLSSSTSASESVSGLSASTSASESASGLSSSTSASGLSSSTSASESASGLSSSTSASESRAPDATLTSSWTGVYTTTFLTTGTDSSVTEIVEVPSASASSRAPDATLTSSWTGVYTTTFLTTGTDSSVTEIVEVPSSSASSRAPDATLTSSWTGVYTTTFLTTGTDSSVTEIVEVPSASAEEKSTVVYTSGHSAFTGVVIVETLSASHGNTLITTTTSVLLETDRTLSTSVGTGIPQVSSSYEGGGSKLGSVGVLMSLLSLFLAALF
jgi:hypothetical protein